MNSMSFPSYAPNYTSVRLESGNVMVLMQRVWVAEKCFYNCSFLYMQLQIDPICLMAIDALISLLYLFNTQQFSPVKLQILRVWQIISTKYALPQLGFIALISGVLNETTGCRIHNVPQFLESFFDFNPLRGPMITSEMWHAWAEAALEQNRENVQRGDSLNRSSVWWWQKANWDALQLVWSPLLVDLVEWTSLWSFMSVLEENNYLFEVFIYQMP